MEHGTPVCFCSEEIQLCLLIAAGDFLPQEERRYKFERQKIALAQLFTDFGFDVLVTDVDVVWLRNPLPVFSRYRPA